MRSKLIRGRRIVNKPRKKQISSDLELNPFPTYNWTFIKGSFEIIDALDPKLNIKLNDKERVEIICDKLGLYNFKTIFTNDSLDLRESFSATISDKDKLILSRYIMAEYGFDIILRYKASHLIEIPLSLFKYKNKVKTKTLEEIYGTLRGAKA